MSLHGCSHSYIENVKTIRSVTLHRAGEVICLWRTASRDAVLHLLATFGDSIFKKVTLSLIAQA